MTDGPPGASAVHVRITINGEVVVDEDMSWDMEEVRVAGERHAAIIERASAEGALWLAEITDPDGDVPPLKYGSDTSTMEAPVSENDIPGGLMAGIDRQLAPYLGGLN